MKNEEKKCNFKVRQMQMNETVNIKDIDGSIFSIKDFDYAPQDEYSEFALADLPMYTERVNKQLNIIQMGDDNQYPNFLLSLLSRSSTHYAITKNKAMYIGGNGFNKTGLSNEALMFLANIHNEYDLEEILTMISLDLEVYGAFALNIIWNKDRTKIAEINYINPRTLRIVAQDPDEDVQVQEYAISKDWRNLLKAENKPVIYPGFSVINRKNPSQILYCKEHRADTYYYGVPTYLSGVRYIECDYEIGDYHRNNIKNGFSPGMTLTFVEGVPSDQQIDNELAKLNAMYAGARGAGNPFVFFADSPETAPIVDIMDAQQNGENFLNLDEKIITKIMIAHQVVSPSIMGIPTPGALASKNEQIQSLKLLQSEYITPKQNFIEKVITRLARVNGVTDVFEISQYELDVEVDVSIADLIAVLTAEISTEQKIRVLCASGYTEEEAKNIVGDGIEPTTPTTPASNKQEQVKMERAKFQKFRFDAIDKNKE